MQFKSMAPGAEVVVVTLKSRWTSGGWVDEDMSVGMLNVVVVVVGIKNKYSEKFMTISAYATDALTDDGYGWEFECKSII